MEGHFEKANSIVGSHAIWLMGHLNEGSSRGAHASWHSRPRSGVAGGLDRMDRGGGTTLPVPAPLRPEAARVCLANSERFDEF